MFKFVPAGEDQNPERHKTGAEAQDHGVGVAPSRSVNRCEAFLGGVLPAATPRAQSRRSS